MSVEKQAESGTRSVEYDVHVHPAARSIARLEIVPKDALDLPVNVDEMDDN